MSRKAASKYFAGFDEEVKVCLLVYQWSDKNIIFSC